MRTLFILLLLVTGISADEIPTIPAKEMAVLEAAMLRNNTPENLKPLLVAIRLAENGSWEGGKAWGVLHPKAQVSPDAQAGWACCTVTKRYEEWKALPVREDHFITFLGRSWAPVGAKNDPKGLNANWVSNVLSFYKAQLP